MVIEDEIIANLKEIIEKVPKEPVSLSDFYSKTQKEKDKEDAKLKRYNDYSEMRKTWSIVLAFCLSISICFQFALTILIGLNLFDFENYKNFLYLVVSENFGQIIGMCIVVVKFLFPNKLLNNKLLHQKK